MQRDTYLAWKMVGSVDSFSNQAQDGQIGLRRVRVGNPVRRGKDYDPVPKNRIQFSVDFKPERSIEVTATHIVPITVGGSRVAHKRDVASLFAFYDKLEDAYQASTIWVHADYPKRRVGKRLLREAVQVVGVQGIIPPKK